MATNQDTFPDGNITAAKFKTDQNGLPVSPDPNAAPATTPAAAATPAAGATMPAGMDPALWKVYQNSGLTPSSDRGTGFADWQYWQGVGNSQYGRLADDIAGKGTDQPTGTPGSGAWSASGAGQPQGGSASGWPTAAGAASTSPVGTANSMDGALGTPEASALYNTLGARAGQSLVVDPNSPVIKAQTDAYRAEQTRAARNLMSQEAERGGTNSNQDANQRSAVEKAAQGTADFQGTLMANEVAARRTEIQNALAGQQGVLTSEQQMALQQELANLDVKLRSYQFGQSQNQQESQFARTLGQNAFQFDTNSQFNNSPLGS